MEVETLQSPDILKELRIFIAGTTRTVRCNELDLARTALNLLKTLPASRDAVLEYFCTVFDTSVEKYMAKIDQLMNTPSPLNQQEDAVVAEIHSVLCNFVTSNPEAWAPIISKWSLQLLGQISSHYSHYVSTAQLNEVLHLWMSCKAARTLVDITTQCLSCLIDSDTETCINNLLDTSVAHSPHFDWVVAHVGSCFPRTVITRVLSCGLKDYCSAKGNVSKSAKFISVVGILGHLASSHFVDIRKALLELFQLNLEEKKMDTQQSDAVVPFLLQLAEKSETLLRALSTDVLHTLNMETLSKLSELAPMWYQYFEDDTEMLEDLVIKLALDCEQGGAKIMTLLLDGTSYPQANVAVTCHVLLELLLKDIDVLLRSDKSVRNDRAKKTTIPFLESIKSEMRQVQHLLLSGDRLKQQTSCRLFKLMGTVNPSVVINSACYLLVRGTNNSHLATLTQLITANTVYGVTEDKNLLALAIEEALRMTSNQFSDVSCDHSPCDSHLLWRNISKLIRYEASCDISALSDNIISKAVAQNLSPLSDILASSYDSETLHAVASVIESLPLSCISSLPLQLMLRVTKNCVKYFFICVTEKDRWTKSLYCHRACDLLSRFCSRLSASRALALRELLESSLFLTASTLFGATKIKVRSQLTQDYLLMEQNHRLGTTTILAQRQSSVFGNGVIGHGIKEQLPEAKLNASVIEENTSLLIKAIRACCVDSSPMTPETSNVSLDAIIQVSLLLVELISPDVMYNGLPWPEEEFCKVTIERDVHIRKIFDKLPLAWTLLEFVSRNEPALCYCSILLRALMATLMSQWNSTATAENKAVLNTTVRLLRIMSVGQLLPPPLSSLQEVIPALTPTEVVTLLHDCVWTYMRDNVPSPALFSRDPKSGFMWRDPNIAKPSPAYTETFRLILQSNIQHFGHLYAKLFVHVLDQFHTAIIREACISYHSCLLVDEPSIIVSAAVTMKPHVLYVVKRCFGSSRAKTNDAVIIGGGHNGLVAAAYLQKHGFKVCVLERRGTLGGAAVTEEIVPGFKFSRASYVLSLFRPQIFTDLNLKEHGLKIHRRNPSSYTPLRQKWWKGNIRSLTLGSDLQFNKQQISQFSKRDAEAFELYEKHLERVVNALEPLFDVSPSQVQRLFNAKWPTKLTLMLQSKELRKAAAGLFQLGWDWTSVYELMSTPPYHLLSQWFESEPLIATLATDAVIGSMTSPYSIGTGYVLLHHVMGQLDGIKGQWGYPEGGMGSVTKAIAASAESMGATLLTHQNVTKILLDEKGQAVGVMSNTGEEFFGRVVLSSVTAKCTFLDLLPPAALDKSFQTAVQNIDYNSPVTKINVAVNKLPDFKANPNRIPNEPMPHHQATIHINCEETSVVHAAYQDALAGKFSFRPMIEMVIPSVLDPTLAPPGQHVCLLFTQYTPYHLSNGRRWDEQTREDYANLVLSNIDEYAPGFSESVVGKEVLSPVDLERIFGLTGGNIFHGALSPDQLFFRRPANPNLSKGNASPFTPVTNLLLCGSGAHPGGGVTGAPGRLAALETMKLLKKSHFNS